MIGRVGIAILVAALGLCACGKSEQEPEPIQDPVPEPEPEPEPDRVAVTWPAGDAAEGRKRFVTNKCFACHMVLLDDGLMAMHEEAEKLAAKKAEEMAAKKAEEHAGHDMAHGPGHGSAHPAGHDKPPPLNAGTLSKPPLVLVKQMVIPGDVEADHQAHYGTYGETLTLRDVSHLAAFLRTIAKNLDDKPDKMLAEDLDLLWPAGDAKVGAAAIAERCNMCHGEGSPKLEPRARPRLVTVWQIAIAEEHGPLLDKLTLRQVSDLVEALTRSP
jgi:mono/diheme cytochrome c family protein